VKRALPFVVALAAAAYIASRAGGPATASDGLELHAFGKIPVIHNGRIKPLDSIARTQLRIISDSETFKDGSGARQPAIRWMLDAMVEGLDPHNHHRDHKIFRIYHPQVLQALGLPQDREGFRYSVNEFWPKLRELESQTRAAAEKQRKEQPLDEQEREILKFHRRFRALQMISSFTIPHLVPPSKEHPEWRTLPEALNDGHGHRDENATAFVEILEAYAKHDAPAFNAKVKEYLGKVGGTQAADARKARFESFFNHLDPLNTCKHLYLVALVLAFGALLGWSGPLNRSAFALMTVLWTVHTLALIGRIYISGRPPVTNLYSSAVFIGWGTVLLGLIFERFFRLGIGNLVAGASGYLSLMIAYVLAAEGDTMEVLQAVLDTQFWLATHVTTITFGYAASYVAGLIGVIYILEGLFTRNLTEARRNALARMCYGTICFAIFFSFFGTVLGGLWADDSWGRFWGWDPKENGALMIVLWNALILHARWGGLVRERGLAVLAVFGNVVVSWSWFGVNELSVGLHSYGFTEGRAKWLAIFMLSQIALMIAGLLPRRMWKSPDAVREPQRGA
jgi:ABC-type transport system involved in cytochrome c biogenesis permease subunit